uniref:Dolichyl-diphosphooligosaccharide--protein glycosyltransferase subunit 4 n=1 Tax=Oryza brachyantha TaxID=4533 RepID=J3LPF6_ORYBR
QISAALSRCRNRGATGAKPARSGAAKMFDDQDLGFFANFLGIFIFVLVMAYHFVMADVKYEGN